MESLKRRWEELARDEPGKRFQKRYERHQESGGGRGRTARLVVGIVLVLVGIVLLPIPGPGSIVVVLGAAFLAQESQTTARLLDRLEVRLRKLASRAVATWRRLSPAMRILILLSGVLTAAAAAWLAYSFFLRL